MWISSFQPDFSPFFFLSGSKFLFFLQQTSSSPSKYFESLGSRFNLADPSRTMCSCYLAGVKQLTNPMSAVVQRPPPPTGRAFASTGQTFSVETKLLSCLTSCKLQKPFEWPLFQTWTKLAYQTKFVCLLSLVWQ